MPVDLDAYCRRIAYAGPRAPTLEVLRALTRLHPQAIAFENISVAAGQVPDITLDAVASKLVDGPRGGYCYEHNCLFQAVLEAFGFRVRPLAARVRFGRPPETVTARSHMLLAVDLEDTRYLADVGFGGLTLTGPVALRHDTVQATPHESVRLVAFGEAHLLQALVGEAWADVYSFDLSLQLPADYEMQNWHTATRPNAFFATNLLATRPVPGGRHRLFNRSLIWSPLGGAPQRRELSGPSEIADVLRDVFAVMAPAAEMTAAAAVAMRAAATP